MPKDKDLKRIVRARMNKTGESYTAARAQVKKTPARRAPSHAAIAGMSDAAVRKQTGYAWAHWVDVLDAAGASGMEHRDIVMVLHEKHAVPDWWAQMVTVGYERIRGLRQKGQRRDGTYEVSRSKTLPVPIGTLYGAFADARRRARWLPGVKVKVKKSTRDKSVRFVWDDGCPVEAYFTAKGKDKSQVSVQHRGLPNEAVAATVREEWTARLDALVETLT